MTERQKQQSSRINRADWQAGLASSGNEFESLCQSNRLIAAATSEWAPKSHCCDLHSLLRNFVHTQLNRFGFFQRI